MSGRAQRFLGLGLLLAVILVVAGFLALGGGDDERTVEAPAAAEAVVVRGVIGGEKEGFLGSKAVRRILADKYGLTVDFTKAGSLDLVRGETTGQDFLWPSSQVALELYQQRPDAAGRAENIFNSPIVLYAWGDVTKALVGAGVAAEEGGVYFVNDFPGLVAMIDQGTPWGEIGLPQLYGGVSIFTTDPTKSNSGNMFAGLLANTLNNGTVVNERTVEPVLPTIRGFYDRLGFLEDSSGDLFRQFLTSGIGAKPIIAGYESQLIEFSLANATYRDLLRERINILYPQPTVWSSHPLIALTPDGNRLLDALKDPELQRMAWEVHGFRSGLIDVQNDPKALDVAGVPATIQSVIPMPKPAVMERIIAALEAPAGEPTPGLVPDTPIASRTTAGRGRRGLGTTAAWTGFPPAPDRRRW